MYDYLTKAMNTQQSDIVRIRLIAQIGPLILIRNYAVA
jgi:hypothetical protein